MGVAPDGKQNVRCTGSAARHHFRGSEFEFSAVLPRGFMAVLGMRPTNHS